MVLEKAMAPHSSTLPGKSHGWRSLVGCSPWGHEESDMTERLHFHFSLSCIGEGNGNPLQCSCLENSRDGGGCWAAVYGVAQSRTQLKWLSSSSSKKRKRSESFCKDSAGRQLSANQQEVSRLPWSWISQPPESWEINVCCLSSSVSDILL